MTRCRPTTLPARIGLGCAFGCLLFCSPALPAVPATAAAEAPRDVTESPAYETFVVIPLRVHVLTADDLPEADCKLTDADVERIIGKVNGVWHKAGVHFGVESVLHEPAEGREAFREARARRPAGTGPRGRAGACRIRWRRSGSCGPKASRQFDGLHVYYVHELAGERRVHGPGLRARKETAALRPVRGGIDEPIRA